VLDHCADGSLVAGLAGVVMQGAGVNYAFTAADQQVEQLRTAAEEYTP
jgi:hypothetical protein